MVRRLPLRACRSTSSSSSGAQHPLATMDMCLRWVTKNPQKANASPAKTDGPRHAPS